MILLLLLLHFIKYFRNELKLYKYVKNRSSGHPNYKYCADMSELKRIWVKTNEWANEKKGELKRVVCMHLNRFISFQEERRARNTEYYGKD